MSEQATPRHLRTAYLFINILLFAPVLLWPIPMMIYENPSLNEFILPKWSMSIIILLVTSTVMDSILQYLGNPKKLTQSILWVGMINLLIFPNQNQVWFLAALFLLHSFRSAYILYQNSQELQAWVGIAWARDIIMACIIFLSLAILS
ncbi:MAG: hypothetical protein R8M14_02260 [Ghiorsea sp.]